MSNLRHAPNDAPVVNIDPELRLLAAIINCAWRDMNKGNQYTCDAYAYFNGTNFEVDCAWFNLNPDHARRLVSETFMKPILNDEQVRTIHAQYMSSKRSLAQHAADHGVSTSTLHNAFKRVGLATRRPRPAAAAPATVDGDLNQLLAALAAAGHTIARVTIIDLAGEEKQPS